MDIDLLGRTSNETASIVAQICDILSAEVAPDGLAFDPDSILAERSISRELNSRMKDFYDIWLLSRQFDFAGENLAEAIRLTFDRRGTPLPDDIVAFTEHFWETKQTQWAAFHRRLRQDHVPASFSEIIVSEREFIDPIAAALSSGKAPPARWSAPGPWD